jgi:hypothetical protein
LTVITDTTRIVHHLFIPIERRGTRQRAKAIVAMLVARDQENLVARHQTEATLKQSQNSQLGNRYPKTPIKIPLNDENAGHFKGAKSILGNRTRGNENATTSKGLKELDKSRFVTPMGTLLTRRNTIVWKT